MISLYRLRTSSIVFPTAVFLHRHCRSITSRPFLYMSSASSDSMSSEDEAAEEASVDPALKSTGASTKFRVSDSASEDFKLKEKGYQDKVHKLEQELIKSYLRNRQLAAHSGQGRIKYESAALEFMQMGTHPLVLSPQALKPKNKVGHKNSTNLMASVLSLADDEHPAVIEVCEFWLQFCHLWLNYIRNRPHLDSCWQAQTYPSPTALPEALGGRPLCTLFFV